MNVLDLGIWYSLAAALPAMKWDSQSCKKVVSLFFYFLQMIFQEEDRIVDLVEWGWSLYSSDRIDRVFDSKMRVMKIVAEKRGSNFYDMPRSGKKTGNGCIPAITMSSFTPHHLEVGDRIEVYLRDTSSSFAGQFYQGTVEKVTERWCTVKYDDGDVFSDYFDSLPGSQIFRKIES